MALGEADPREAAPADATVVSAPVVEVRILEDRAHVTRRGKVTLPAGHSRLRIEDTSPVIVDKTLVARIAAPGGARVHDARVRRQRRIRIEDRPEEIRALDKRIETEADKHAELSARRAVAFKELESIGHFAGLALSEMAEDASFARFEPREWGTRLDTLAESARRLRDDIAARDLEISRLNESLKRLRARRAALEEPSAVATAWIELDVSATAAGEHELHVSYLVPSACWRPYHRARLLHAGKDGRVAIECEACVWQSTGEAWTDVALTFSTERASLGVEPPTLRTDLLLARKKSAALVVQAREEQIEVAGLGAGEMTTDAPEGGATTAAGAVKQTARLAGIDDGGETLLLRAAHRATIPPDGRPLRVPIYAFESPAETDLVLFGELVPAVLLRSVQTNSGSQPLLAGPIDLVRDSGLVGRTQVLYVAPGEKFELGWGPESALRVQRTIEPLKDEETLLGNWTTSAHDVKVRLSNLGEEARIVRVRERVPVSEIEKVQIHTNRDHTTDKKAPDEHGLLEWEVRLAPLGHATVQLRCAIKKHSDVVGL